MLSSPRRPSSTMRIFSSAEWCRRVALRISRTVFSALSGMRLLACLIVAPQRGYDEPAILSYAISSFCPTSADGLQLEHHRHKCRDHQVDHYTWHLDGVVVGGGVPSTGHRSTFILFSPVCRATKQPSSIPSPASVTQRKQSHDQLSRTYCSLHHSLHCYRANGTAQPRSQPASSGPRNPLRKCGRGHFDRRRALGPSGR